MSNNTLLFHSELYEINELWKKKSGSTHPAKDI